MAGWAGIFSSWTTVAYSWTKSLPKYALFGKNYTFQVTFGTSIGTRQQDGAYTHVNQLQWLRNPYMSSVGTGFYDVPGTLTFEIHGGGNLIEDDTGAITLADASTVNTFEMSFVHGRYEATISFNEGALVTNGIYQIRLIRPNGLIALAHFMQMTPANLEFTSQPVTETEVYLPLGSPAVSFLDSNGDVITGETSNVVLTAVKEDETPLLEGTLQGTTTVAAVAGVATFTDLSFDYPGVIRLSAASGSNLPAISDPITILGIPIPDTITGLRQNIAEDGTIWQKSTGVSSPTYAAATEAEQLTLDGDNVQTDTVTTDGIRLAFLYPMFLRGLFLRGTMSALTNTPTIEIYTSADTTDGEDGTFTLLTQFTPQTVNIFQGIEFGEVTAESPVIRGIWVTLNDQGGPVTMDWQSVHVRGMYIGASVLYGDSGRGSAIIDEAIVNIPGAGDELFEDADVERGLFLQSAIYKNTSVTITQKAARFGGDTLADSDNFSFTDTDDVTLTTELALPPNSQTAYKQKYTIDTADNVGDGQHLSRVTAQRIDDPVFVVQSSTNGDIEIHKQVDGAIVRTIAPSGAPDVNGMAVDFDNSEVYVSRGSGGKPWDFDVYSMDTGFLLRTFTMDDASLVSTAPSHLHITANGDLVITATTNTAGQTWIALQNDGTFIRKGAHTSPQASAVKGIAVGAGDGFWSFSGAGSAEQTSQFVTTSSTEVRALTDPTDIGGFPESLWYDPTGDGGFAELVVCRQVGAAFHVGRYKESDGTFTAGPSALTIPTGGTIVTGGWVDTAQGLEYVIWNSSIIQVYNRRDYSSASTPYSDFTDFTGTSLHAYIQRGTAKKALPGYFGGVTLTNKGKGDPGDSGLAVEELNFAIVLHESEAPVPERFTTWGLSADAGVLYQTLSKPNQTIIGDSGVIYLVDGTVSSDDGRAITVHYRSVPVPNVSREEPNILTERRFHEVVWVTEDIPPAEGWLVTYTAIDKDDAQNIWYDQFVQNTREVRRKCPLRARQIIIDIQVTTTQNYNITGIQLEYQNTDRPIRGL